MKYILQGSCSEAVLRINLKNLTELEIKELEELLEKLSDEEKHEEWYDTSWFKESIFGMPLMIIKGETPYNQEEWLISGLSKLVFWDRVKYEFGE